MLHISAETLLFLKKQQAAAEAAERRRLAVAVHKPPRKLDHKRLSRLVASAALILRAGHPTLFEYEAACRRGLRIALIRQGWVWADADRSAAKVVEIALHSLGAERPTWKEGQSDFAIADRGERYRCARCGDALEGDRYKYCSKSCGQLASQTKARASGERLDRAQYLASLALRKEEAIRERSEPCEHCGKYMLTLEIGQRFCSTQCSGARRKIYKDKPCPTCAKLFYPNVKNGIEKKFCSNACSWEQKRVAKPEATCPTCESVFRWRTRTIPQKYCSARCSPRSAQFAGRSAFKCEGTE